MLKLSDVFDIQEQKIIAKRKCSTQIDMKEYDIDTVVETSTYFELPGLLSFYCDELDDYTQVSLNYRINLNKSKNIVEDKNIVTINYDPKDVVIYKEYFTDELDIGLIVRLLQGRLKYVKDPKILLNMLYNHLNDMDLVHLEVVISNMFRNAQDDSILCRWSGNYKDSLIIGQSNQPKKDSWLNSLIYMKPEEAIKAGLVKGRPARQDPIELVAMEQFRDL